MSSKYIKLEHQAIKRYLSAKYHIDLRSLFMNPVSRFMNRDYNHLIRMTLKDSFNQYPLESKNQNMEIMANNKNRI